MSTFRVYPSVTLDEDAHEFIDTFLSHVATIAGGPYRSVTLARARALLVAAILRGDGDSMAAWSMLHRTISQLLAEADSARETCGALAYLESFLQENADLSAAPGVAQATLARTIIVPYRFLRDGSSSAILSPKRLRVIIAPN